MQVNGSARECQNANYPAENNVSRTNAKKIRDSQTADQDELWMIQANSMA
jgi:hypothetical protein